MADKEGMQISRAASPIQRRPVDRLDLAGRQPAPTAAKADPKAQPTRQPQGDSLRTRAHDALDRALPKATQAVVPETWQGTIEAVREKAVDAGAGALIWLGDLHPAIAKTGHQIYGLMTRKADGPNVEKLSALGEKVLRGAQPTEEGFRQLKAQGVKTVINLRPEDNRETAMVEKLGMKAIYLPLPPLDAPTHAETLSFLKTALDPANGKVFFHCYHGVDRTGTMAAAIRIARDGWTADQAIAELRSEGFHEAGQKAKLHYIQRFESYWKSLPIEKKSEILHKPISQGPFFFGVA
ncbi:Tyrosine phosphatase family protein [compost metagenome]